MLCKAGGGVQVGVPSYGPCEEAEETGRGVAWPTTVRSQVVAGRYPSRGRAWVRMEGPAPTHSAWRVPWGLKDPPPGTSSRGSVADLRLVTHPHQHTPPRPTSRASHRPRVAYITPTPTLTHRSAHAWPLRTHAPARKTDHTWTKALAPFCYHAWP